MSTTFELALPRSIVLTANQRMHWAVKSDRTRQIRARSKRAAMEHFGFDRGLSRTWLLVHIAYPDRRKRDVHNWMPTAKACVDGFVDAGLWVDDSTDYLVGPDLRVMDATCPPGQIRLAFTFTTKESS